MNLMVEADCSFSLPEGLRGLVSRYVSLRPHILLDADMAAGALGIGGKSVFSVMASAAVFALIEGFHDEILLFLDLERLHFKETVVALNAGKALISPVLFMSKENGLHRFGIKDTLATAFFSLGLAVSSRSTNQ